MTACVLDTSVASFLLDNRPQLALYKAHLQNATTLYVSFQTVAEMRFGALKSGWGVRRRQGLEAFLTSLQIVGYTDQLALLWAQAMLQGQANGRRLEAGDAWIAATAALLNAPLLTHDKDFAPAVFPSIAIRCYAT